MFLAVRSGLTCDPCYQLEFGDPFGLCGYDLCDLWSIVSSEITEQQQYRQVRQQDAYPANAGGGSYNYAQAQHPAPFSRATSPSLIVCLYLASSKLLKLEINMHHLRMAMQYRQAVNPLSEFGEILCRWAWIRRCFLLSKIWTLYV